ncbi:2-methylcitrate dehydratase PrpD [Hyaloscypha hepaticicola]|uniref:2-methylcitrate dehydratase PrpD n=1 Tax=Hyaloscypha hepaticicola TaxID=2082293 RepID=A0A2J6PNG2_9HELO|nr:2-methylcitrate dehydratase PrpD [Hyaloscypha hepaticicola]
MVSLVFDVLIYLSIALEQLTYEDLPPEVIEHAKRAILNILGCALGSANATPRRKALAALLPSEPVERASGVVTIWGRPERANLDDGAILNGIAATTADYDDTHLETVIHVACTAIAAVLPFAEAHHLSGKEVILAFVAAVETQCAVALAVSPSSYANGWHITGLTGSFSGAAGVAKLLRLPPNQFAAALGHASSMASGTRAMFGTDTKTLHAGQHARNGITAAKLAKEGFASCVAPIEAWARLLSTTVDTNKIGALARGGPWQIFRVSFKPYPCGIVIHPLTDTCLEMHAFFSSANKTAEGPKRVEDIGEIEIVANPQLVRLCNVRHPRTGLETIFSLYHGFHAVRDIVTVRVDDKMRDDEAILHFRSRSSSRGDISEQTIRIERALGSVENPLSKGFLEEKFLRQAEGSLDIKTADAIIKACWELELVEDVSEMVKLLGATWV